MTVDNNEYERLKNARVPTELHCPQCQTLHVDEDEWAHEIPHRKHLCAACKHIWEPYPVTTIGVDFHVECADRVKRAEADVAWIRSEWQAEIEKNDQLRTALEAALKTVETISTRNDDITRRRDALLDQAEVLSQRHDRLIAEAQQLLDQAATSLTVSDAEVERLNNENRSLIARRDELLQLVAKLSRETPYADEFEECKSARAALIAEVGTLRAKLAEQEKLFEAAQTTQNFLDALLDGLGQLMPHVPRTVNGIVDAVQAIQAECRRLRDVNLEQRYQLADHDPTRL